MKLINKFGLAALLIVFLAVPSLAQKHHGGETTQHSKSYKQPQAAPSTAPTMESRGTKTNSRIPSGFTEESKKGKSGHPMSPTIMKTKHESVKNN